MNIKFLPSTYLFCKIFELNFATKIVNDDNTFGSPAQISTYAGNALSCAAGMAAFNIYYSDEFKKL